jgi:uncharacterized protein YndB with AHSA1/START domain
MTTDSITVTVTTPSEREAVVTRIFDAPAALVFEAVTNAELIARWYGPPGSLESCESDTRVGGAWRFAMKAGDKQMVKYGIYTEFDPPRRFVRTERYEGWDIGEMRMTVELVEKDGKTTLTQRVLFPSQEVRDTIMKMGLTPQAMSAFYARLESLLGSMA